MVELEDNIKEASVDGTIKCEQALGIARKHGIPAKEMGAKLNEMEIKIKSCQLGCF